ncbi:hypothetical protein VMCG_04806 [Cytospora schulzeri]|uniref:F-box domain-containing protein n=1 Tax=Cytospora schulzeri TaxID=448051 RepID=A0A423WN03_9PEZI|nr:hypothetical protein VMCG_04806 [Valsa malicola]
MSRDAVQNGCAPDAASTSAQPQSQQAQIDRLILLPERLLLMIFTIISQDSRHDLCNLSLANKKYHAIADRFLYKSILFESPEHHLTFSESLHRRPRRGSLIQDVKLEYPTFELSHLILDTALEQSDTSHYSRKGIDGLSRTLSAMSNLETLDIAVPVKLLHGIGALFNGPFDLACLKTCSLLYQCPDNAYWDLRENIHIFTHPTLETLTIKRAKLDEKGFDFMERPHSTSLKSLRLIECDINDDSLADILEFPEALKEFYMYHTADPQPELEESSNEINEHIMALKDQAETLESITIDHPTLGGRKVLRLRDFQSCKTLRLNHDTQLFGKTGKKPRMHSAGLPPQLETLEFFEPLGTDEVVTDLFCMMLESIDFMARRLKTLTVPEGPNGVPEQILEACKGKNFELKIRRQGENGHRGPSHPDDRKTRDASSVHTENPKTQAPDREIMHVKDRVRWNAVAEEAWGKTQERKPFEPS